MAAFTIHLDDDKARKLTEFASRLGRSQADIAAEAIEDDLVCEEWQIAEVEAGIAEADRGGFASADELAKLFGARVLDPSLPDRIDTGKTRGAP